MKRGEPLVVDMDHLTACLKELLLDMEQAAMKLALLHGVGATSHAEAKSAALALAAVAAGIARDAAFICSRLDDEGGPATNGRRRQ